MSTIAESLAEYSFSLHYSHLPDDVAHLAKRMIIDTIGCAIGGYTSEPSKIARDMASTVTSNVRHIVRPQQMSDQSRRRS